MRLARPQKEGLDYFPLDTDADQDDKLYYIEAKYGLVGFALVIKLLMKIYNNSYYKLWGEKETIIFAKQTSADINVINNLINDCINESFFNKNLYEKYHILTSSGIQKRYLKACERRTSVEMYSDFILIDPGNYKNLVIVYINPINSIKNIPLSIVNDGINPQSKGKESKLEEEDNKGPSEEVFNNKDFKKIIEFFNSNIHPIKQTEAEELNEWMDVIDSDVIIMAIKEAVRNGARSIKYINSILIDWQENGIKTKADAEGHLKEWEERKQKKKEQRGVKKDAGNSGDNTQSEKVKGNADERTIRIIKNSKPIIGEVPEVDF